MTVPYSPNLYHLKSKGDVAGTFIRLGSTNRLADAHIIAEIKKMAKRVKIPLAPTVSQSKVFKGILYSGKVRQF